MTARMAGLIAIILILAVIAGAFLRYPDAFTLLRYGSLSLDDDLQPLVMSKANRLAIVFVLAVLLAGMFYLGSTLHTAQARVNSNKVIAQQLSERRLAEEREREARILADQKIELSSLWNRLSLWVAEFRQSKINSEVNARLLEVESTTLPNGDELISGTRIFDENFIAHQVKELSVRDKVTGAEKALLVVHLFQDRGYWDFSSPNVITDKNGNDSAKFWTLFNSAVLQDELRNFDVVIGVGLASKTPVSDDSLSESRAGFLCSGISGSFRKFSDIDVLGLDIGSYQGSLSETIEQQDIRLRPIVIAAIKVNEQEVSDITFYEHLIETVRIGGLDFGSFSRLQARNPKWIQQSECLSKYSFTSQSER